MSGISQERMRASDPIQATLVRQRDQYAAGWQLAELISATRGIFDWEECRERIYLQR